MIKRFLQIIICVCLSACVICSSFTACAITGGFDNWITQDEDGNSGADEGSGEGSGEGSDEGSDEGSNEDSGEGDSQEKPDDENKPTQTQTQKPNDTPAGPAQNNTTTTTTTEATTEEQSTYPPLPEGWFYIFLQQNNGDEIRRYEMNGEGYVPEPTTPVRKGFVFDGWYLDPGFKKPWNFATDIAKGEMTIYVKWKSDGSATVYPIEVKQSKGGKIYANPSEACMDENVTITVIPDEGKRVVAGSLLINGVPSDIFSFTMPKGKVVVSVEFEDIPQDEQPAEKNNILPFIIAGAGLVLAVIAVAVVLVRRRRLYETGFDGDEIIEDVEDDGWIDETIVVEDGFKEGKIIHDSVEPDYGLPDSDDDE